MCMVIEQLSAYLGLWNLHQQVLGILNFALKQTWRGRFLKHCHLVKNVFAFNWVTVTLKTLKRVPFRSASPCAFVIAETGAWSSSPVPRGCAVARERGAGCGPGPEGAYPVSLLGLLTRPIASAAHQVLVFLPVWQLQILKLRWEVAFVRVPQPVRQNRAWAVPVARSLWCTFLSPCPWPFLSCVIDSPSKPHLCPGCVPVVCPLCPHPLSPEPPVPAPSPDTSVTFPPVSALCFPDPLTSSAPQRQP